MRHIFSFIGSSIKHHINAFWKSFFAGTVAYGGLLLRLSPPDTLGVIGAAWILIKAFGVGAATAMGTTLWAEIWTGIKNRKTSKKNERQKQEKAA